MSDFKTMKFVRETRDKMYEETKLKSNAEIRNYYRDKAGWVNSTLKNTTSKRIRSKHRP